MWKTPRWACAAGALLLSLPLVAPAQSTPAPRNQSLHLAQTPPRSDRHVELVLARRFGLGQGVPQSYATAGSWVTGKGRSDESLEPWDYSIGVAYTVLIEVLNGVRYPARGSAELSDISFVVEIDATAPSRLVYRTTSPNPPSSAVLDDSVRQALQTRLTEVVRWLPPVARNLVVPARVSVPVTIHFKSDTDLAVLQGEPFLR